MIVLFSGMFAGDTLDSGYFVYDYKIKMLPDWHIYLRKLSDTFSMGYWLRTVTFGGKHSFLCD